MDFFIDTANLNEIREAQQLGILNGVTTNPSLMEKEGIKGQNQICNHYKSICDIVNGDVSAEVISTDFEGMIKEGEQLALIDPKIVIKIPITVDGLKAIRYFSDKNIKTNCTLIFTVGQALIAAQAGATYVSPFIGRLDDHGENGIQIVSEMVKLFEKQKYSTKVLGASIRNKNHIIDCAKAGVHVITTPLHALLDLLPHPLTDKGIQTFLKDYSTIR